MGSRDQVKMYTLAQIILFTLAMQENPSLNCRIREISMHRERERERENLTIIATIQLEPHGDLVPPTHRVDTDVLRYDRHFELVAVDCVPVVVALEHLCGDVTIKYILGCQYFI